MEESIIKFISFLSQICQIQAKSDGYRAQLSQDSNNLKLVFDQLDHDQKGEVTCPDILMHCLKNNMQLEATDEQIIGKYFRNFEKGLSYSQFCAILKPKTKSDSQSRQKEAMLVFTQMISQLLSSYKLLQSSRQQLILSGNCNQIVAHFQQKYESPEGFSKQTLREFIYDHDMYSKSRFTLLSSFIYGEIGTFVEWKQFFYLPSPELQQDQPKGSEQASTNEQAAIILPQPKARNVSFQAGHQQDFVQLVSFKNINMPPKQKEQTSQSLEGSEPIKINKNFGRQRKLESQVKRQAERQTFTYNKSPLKSPRESFNNFLTKKCYQRATTRNTSSKYEAQRTPSKIQLKIEQIQISDYSKLVNFQKVPLSAKPHHIAYHPNLRNLESPANSISLSKTKTPKQALYRPMYSRNRISKILYEVQYESVRKSFCPHLLRY